jgi:hypothetical protein
VEEIHYPPKLAIRKLPMRGSAMPIDDPLSAAQTQINADERSSSPEWIVQVAKTVAHLTGSEAVAAFLESKMVHRKQENTAYLVEVLISEFRALEERVGELKDEAHLSFVKTELPGLLLEAYRRTRETRSRERIRRIGKIVVHAVEVGPSKPGDVAEEMMRIASEVSDEEVAVLREIYDAQVKDLAKYGRPDINEVNGSWKLLISQHSLFSGTDIQSICAKLQSFGLVTMVERIPTMLDLYTTPYGLLSRGREFIEYAISVC